MTQFEVAEDVVLIPIGRLLDNSLNDYIRGDSVTEESCAELALSIKENGVTVPLLVTPYRAGFYIVHGHRRRFAGRMAGLIELPCIIKPDLTPEQQFDLMLNENLQRKDLTLLAQARCYKKLTDEGKSISDIKRKTGISKTRINSLLVVIDLEPELQQLFERERLHLNAAPLIAKLPDPKSRLYFARAAAKHQWALTTIERKVDHWNPVDPATVEKKTKPHSEPRGTLVNPDHTRLTKSEALALFDDADSFSLADLKRGILGSCCDNCDEQRFPDICEACPTTQILATLLDLKGLRYPPPKENGESPETVNERVN